MKRSFLAVATALALCLGTKSFGAIDVHNVAKGTEPSIAADEKGVLHASLLNGDGRSSNCDVFYVRSADSGTSWTSPTNVSKSPGICSHPDVAVDKAGSINVVWSDTRTGVKGHDIFFARSDDNGKSWTEPLDISKTAGMATEPCLATAPDQSIYVVWRDTASDEGRPDIFYSSSNDKGKTWSQAEDVSNTPKRSSDPTIAAGDDGVVHVAWLDSRSGELRPDIFYIRKSGGAWSKPLNVSNSERLSAHPSIACGPKGGVYLLWSDNSRKEKSPDIWCAVGNKKERFAKPINISDTPGVSSQPTIAGDDKGRVVVAWSDTSPGAPHIYARISKDHAGDFSAILDLPHILDASNHPRATISGEQAFIIWQETNADDSKVQVAALSLTKVATGPLHLVDPEYHPSAASRNH